ncbi:MAG: hypothetical protein AB7O56_09265 [Bauldia sp.]
MTGNYDLTHLIGALLVTLVTSWIALLILAPIPGPPALRRAINGRKLKIWLAHGASVAATSVFFTADIPVEEAVFLNVLAEAMWLIGDLRRFGRSADDPAARRIDLTRGLRPGTGIPVFALLVAVFGYSFGGEAIRWNFAALRWPDAPAPFERVDALVLSVGAEPIVATDLPDMEACRDFIAAHRPAPRTPAFCAAGRDDFGRLPAEHGLPTAYRVVAAM